MFYVDFLKNLNLKKIFERKQYYIVLTSKLILSILRVSKCNCSHQIMYHFEALLKYVNCALRKYKGSAFTTIRQVDPILFDYVWNICLVFEQLYVHSYCRYSGRTLFSFRNGVYRLVHALKVYLFPSEITYGILPSLSQSHPQPSGLM